MHVIIKSICYISVISHFVVKKKILINIREVHSSEVSYSQAYRIKAEIKKVPVTAEQELDHV